MIKPSALLLYPLFAPIFLLNEAVKAENLSIGNGNFQSMRPCAQSCLGDPSGDDVRTGIGCGTVNGLGQNECYCREDLQPAASSWLSTCVMARCSSNTVDLTSVISLYDNYCATALAAEATTSGSAATTTGGTTTSSGGIPKQTSSSASSSTFGPSLSTTIRSELAVMLATILFLAAATRIFAV
ncbi:hypothetical protein DL95DRAFT_469887 [Leptodontidium sp. 2 PMI_412]|nr:hypothetical protein DL95DRAFT_469887 [Leptodontidium sp. 2 PMI_412]